MSEHDEQHRTGQGNVLRNLVLGAQDGVVNVLGVILGVAIATSSTHIVLLAGLATAFAESVSMAAVAYTSSRAENEHYEAEIKREENEMDTIPEREREEIKKIYAAKGFEGKLLDQVVDKICSNRKVWLDTMMREELKLSDPSDTLSPVNQAVLVGVSAMTGSIVPIVPFFFTSVDAAIVPALAFSLVVLFMVGAYKSSATSGKWVKGGIELSLIGGAAALTGFAIGLVFKTPPA